MRNSARLQLIRAATTLAAMSAMGIVYMSLVTPVPAQSSLTYERDFGDEDDPCTTEHRLREYVAGKGYSSVKLNSASEPWHVSAMQGNRVYQLLVSTCPLSIVGKRALGSV